jgi:hypothetical protein
VKRAANAEVGLRVSEGNDLPRWNQSLEYGVRADRSDPRIPYSVL